MTREEIVERIMKIENRSGIRRGIKSYALRGNVLSPREEETLVRYAEEYALFYSDSLLDFKSTYGNGNPTLVEIGFGNGDAFLEIAETKKDFNHLGLDVYLKGFIDVLSALGEGNVKNARVMRYNCIDVLENMIPPDSVAGFHIFFPDPWPKKKHHKRRLINPSFLSLLSSRLKDGGYAYIATDIEDYAEEILSAAEESEGLVNPCLSFAPPVSWRPKTRFEKKGIEGGRRIREIWLEKKS